MMQAVQLTEDQKREKAFEIYCKTPKIGLMALAKKVGVTTEQVKQWKDSAGWIFIRERLHRDKREQLLAQIGDPEEVEIRLIQIAQKLVEDIHRELTSDGPHSVAAKKEMIIVVKEASKVRAECMQRLGLDEWSD